MSAVAFPVNEAQDRFQEQRYIATDQTAELMKLIHELSTIRQRMLELEALGLRQTGEVHPTYPDRT